MYQDKLSPETHKQARKLLQNRQSCRKRAQEENRKKGIPNVYDFNGHLYYELPNGELTKEDPYPLSEETDSKEEKC